MEYQSNSVEPVADQGMTDQNVTNQNVTNQDGFGNGASPKKSKRGLLIAVCAVLVLIAAVSPFVYGMVMKSYLQNHPNLYVLDSFDRTDYKRSAVNEFSVVLEDEQIEQIASYLLGYTAMSNPMLSGVLTDFQMASGVKEKAAELVRGLKLRIRSSHLDTDAAGTDPLANLKFEFLFKDKLLFDFSAMFSEEAVRVDVADKNLIYHMGSKLVFNFEEQEKSLDRLKKDKEIREILATLFASASLKEKDLADSVTGEKCDVISIRVTLKDLYLAIKSFIGILDSNDALKAYFESVLLSSVEGMKLQGYDDSAVEEFKAMIESGSYITTLKRSFSAMDFYFRTMLDQIVFWVDGDLYVNKKGLVRSDLTFHAQLDDSNDPVVVGVNAHTYISDMPLEGSVVADANSISLDGMQYGWMGFEVLYPVQDQISKTFFGSEGYAELKQHIKDMVVLQFGEAMSGYLDELFLLFEQQ